MLIPEKAVFVISAVCVLYSMPKEGEGTSGDLRTVLRPGPH